MRELEIGTILYRGVQGDTFGLFLAVPAGYLPLLGKQTDCRIKLGDKTEIVGVGNVGRHGMHLYAQSIYHKLPARLRAMLPKPPKE